MGRLCLKNAAQIGVVSCIAVNCAHCREFYNQLYYLTRSLYCGICACARINKGSGIKYPVGTGDITFGKGGNSEFHPLM